jgi:hypothetical protein
MACLGLCLLLSSALIGPLQGYTNGRLLFHHFLYILAIQYIKGTGGYAGDGGGANIIVQQRHFAKKIAGK